MMWRSFLLLGIMGYTSFCYAADAGRAKDLEISIYNNNLALVKDSRDAKLQKGGNDMVFEGVASQIKPESVIIVGKGIKVLEQNYNYDLLTPQNIIEKSIGQEVKTVIQNPQTGENMFDQAKIISSNYGSPILEFSYGIEPNFPGRIVFERLPESLRSKPTLIAKLYSIDAGVQELTLAYLTNGISWKTNYVAKVSGSDKLDLTGWVTINNQSGVDYKDAKVQLIAGDVNQVQNIGGLQSKMNRMMVSKAVMADAAVTETGAGAPQQISGYHLYSLPENTDIKDNQTKQISLMEKNNVKFVKEGRLVSPLYIGDDYQSNFEKRHPSLIYTMMNVEADNLGLPLPAGIVRFYENDKNGNLQFIGENSIAHVAKGEKIELNLGNFFNIFINGKILNVNKLSSEKISQSANSCEKFRVIRSYDVEIVFNNAGDQSEMIVFEQGINQKTKIIKENIAGKSKDMNRYEWRINVPADNKTILKFTAEVTSEERICD